MSNKTLFHRARSIVLKKCKERGYSDDEINSLARTVQYYYLDSYNYKNAYNLRIAKKFDRDEWKEYEVQLQKSRNQIYETTVYSGGKLENGGSEFYFGFNYKK